VFQTSDYAFGGEKAEEEGHFSVLFEYKSISLRKSTEPQAQDGEPEPKAPQDGREPKGTTG